MIRFLMFYCHLPLLTITVGPCDRVLKIVEVRILNHLIISQLCSESYVEKAKLGYARFAPPTDLYHLDRDEIVMNGTSN